MPGNSDRLKSFYVGNLKRAKRFYPLEWFHFLMASADNSGNLLKKNVLVQYIGCKIDGDYKFILLCKECNEEWDSLQQILMRGNVSNTFIKDIVDKYCIHCKVCLEFNPQEIFPINESSFPWFFGSDLVDMQVLQEKPLLCAVLSGGGYGILSLPPRAKHIRCIYPCKESKSCTHVRTYESNEGKEDDVIQSQDLHCDVLSDFVDLDINGDDKCGKQTENLSRDYNSSPSKLNWPPTAEMQQKFRDFANCDLSQLKNFIPTFDSKVKCRHGFMFDERDPVKHSWVQSRNVKVYDTEWLPDIERQVYFRPSVGSCNCRQNWTGEQELLLNISKNQLGKVSLD